MLTRVGGNKSRRAKKTAQANSKHPETCSQVLCLSTGRAAQALLWLSGRLYSTRFTWENHCHNTGRLLATCCAICNNKFGFQIAIKFSQVHFQHYTASQDSLNSGFWNIYKPLWWWLMSQTCRNPLASKQRKDKSPLGCWIKELPHYATAWLPSINGHPPQELPIKSSLCWLAETL